jgi:hypothetical protein
MSIKYPLINKVLTWNKVPGGAGAGLFGGTGGLEFTEVGFVANEFGDIVGEGMFG